MTPSRGGWAFARAREMRVVCSDGRDQWRVSAAGYKKLRAHLFDSGRRELLSYRLGVKQLAGLVKERGLDLMVGRATIRIRGQRMKALREFMGRLAIGPAKPN